MLPQRRGAGINELGAVRACRALRPPPSGPCSRGQLAIGPARRPSGRVLGDSAISLTSVSARRAAVIRQSKG